MTATRRLPRTTAQHNKSRIQTTRQRCGGAREAGWRRKDPPPAPCCLRRLPCVYRWRDSQTSFSKFTMNKIPEKYKYCCVICLNVVKPSQCAHIIDAASEGQQQVRSSL